MPRGKASFVTMDLKGGTLKNVESYNIEHGSFEQSMPIEVKEPTAPEQSLEEMCLKELSDDMTVTKGPVSSAIKHALAGAGVGAGAGLLTSGGDFDAAKTGATYGALLGAAGRAASKHISGKLGASQKAKKQTLKLLKEMGSEGQAPQKAVNEFRKLAKMDSAYNQELQDAIEGTLGNAVLAGGVGGVAAGFGSSKGIKGTIIEEK